ncbi:MAG: hypothetical protein KKE73_08755 [Proteobacteria bacterium]|nr:hypothetical protein [Pseudomonadota bacterium]
MGIVIGTTVIAGIVGRIMYKRSAAKGAPATAQNATPVHAPEGDKDTALPQDEPLPDPSARQD